MITRTGPSSASWPTGQDPFAAAAPGWRGFGPAKIPGPHSLLLPADRGRRVAVYRCSCGEPGRGVVAAVIVPSPGGRQVSWADFRDYAGVFNGPVTGSADEGEGRPWKLPGLHFGREQHVAEIERVSQDRSWETDRRKTARLVHERLEPPGLVLPPDFTLARASPAWSQDGVALMSESHTPVPRLEVRPQMLRLASTLEDPDQAAAEMVQRLLSTSPSDWASSFGRSPA